VNKKLEERVRRRVFRISGNNKGLMCPFKLILCQEGYCSQCQIYIDWQKQAAAGIEEGKHEDTSDRHK